MFRSALFKLTGVYLFILMSVSLAFSLNLYRVSVGEIDNRLRRQVDFITRDPNFVFVGPGSSPYETERENELHASQQHVLAELLYANLFILVVGGFGSYLLARLTLAPIEEAHAAQARFTADASHELRTPLAAMRTETEVALRDKNLSLPEAREQLESNLEELTRLSDLSEGLLMLARGNNDASRYEVLKLSSIVLPAVEQLSSLAKQKHIELKVSKLPRVNLFGDSAQLTQVLVILIDNALKYSEPKTAISVSAIKQTSQVVIEVTDQGQGIAPSDLAHVFERFYRADEARSKANVSGHGLGLAIAKQVVEQHSGTISATSTPGTGSTFMVRLPIHSA